MLYLKEATDNLQPSNFYQLTSERQHRTLDVLYRASEEFPYLLEMNKIYAHLTEIWRLTISQDLLDNVLQTKVEELLLQIQSMMEQLGLNSGIPLVIVDCQSANGEERVTSELSPSNSGAITTYN
jgi:hypothetical protein